MKTPPTPLECLFLWRLASAGGGDWLKNIKPALDAGPRNRLVEAGLIELEKRKPDGVGRAINHVSLADGGWAWLSDHRDHAIPSRANSAETLGFLLRAIQTYLDASNLSLAEFFRLPTPSTQAASPPVVVEALEDRIESAYLQITGGEVNARVRLAAIRSALGDVGRDELDAALGAMAASGKATLYRLDNPREITDADREAEWMTPSGDERHVLYLGGRSS